MARTNAKVRSKQSWRRQLAACRDPRSHGATDVLQGGARAAAMLCLLSMSCTPSEPNKLDELGTARITVKGQPFDLWVADEYEEQTRGLMFVTADQMATLPDGTRRGMIFIFDHEQNLSFWMRNTIIALDIAYLDSTGRVVATYTMAPLDDQLGKYQSHEPARMAIEVNAGVWKELGLIAGDRIEIPASLLKRRS